MYFIEQKSFIILKRESHENKNNMKLIEKQHWLHLLALLCLTSFSPVIMYTYLPPYHTSERDLWLIWLLMLNDIFQLQVIFLYNSINYNEGNGCLLLCIEEFSSSQNAAEIYDEKFPSEFNVDDGKTLECQQKRLATTSWKIHIDQMQMIKWPKCEINEYTRDMNWIRST